MLLREVKGVLANQPALQTAIKAVEAAYPDKAIDVFYDGASMLEWTAWIHNNKGQGKTPATAIIAAMKMVEKHKAEGASL